MGESIITNIIRQIILKDRVPDSEYIKKCEPVVKLYDQICEMTSKIFGEGSEYAWITAPSTGKKYWFGKNSKDEIGYRGKYQPDDEYGLGLDLKPIEFIVPVAEIKRTDEGASLYTPVFEKRWSDKNLLKLAKTLTELYEVAREELSHVENIE